MEKLRKIREGITVFLFGGFSYSLMEIAFRGFTHWTMTVTGGLCLLIMYCHFAAEPEENMLGKCLYGTAVITAFEFFVGCIVNLLLRWDVWDYSAAPLNIMGQVCLSFSAMWFLVTIPAVGVCGLFRKSFAAPALRELPPERLQ